MTTALTGLQVVVEAVPGVGRENEKKQRGF